MWLNHKEMRPEDADRMANSVDRDQTAQEYNKKKIQIFAMNMTYLSWNIYFFTLFDEIKVIFMTKIWISSIYLLVH